MSAYLVNNETFGRVMKAIEKAGRHGREYLLIDQLKDDLQNNPGSVFQRLFALNVKSLQERYDDQQAIKPNASDYKQAKKVYDNPFGTSDVQLYKSLQCFLYQSCEGDANKEPLYKAIDCIKDCLASEIIRKMPMYEEADWS